MAHGTKHNIYKSLHLIPSSLMNGAHATTRLRSGTIWVKAAQDCNETIVTNCCLVEILMYFA